METKKSTVLVGSIAIAAGIALSGLFIKQGINNFAYRDRVVTVRGLAEREVKADKVTWPITYQVAGDNLISLYDQVTRNNEVIVSFLTSNGISADEISINPPDTYNNESNQWGSSSFQYKYSLSCSVTVTTEKVDRVRELLNRQSELLKEGIPYSNSYINYEFTGLNSIKPEMIAEATSNAREAAQRFAEDSGQRVGNIKQASQGQFSIDDSSSTTPFVKRVRVVTMLTYYLD